MIMFCSSSLMLIVLDGEVEVVSIINDNDETCISVARENDEADLFQIVMPSVLGAVPFTGLTVFLCRGGKSPHQTHIHQADIV